MSPTPSTSPYTQALPSAQLKTLLKEGTHHLKQDQIHQAYQAVWPTLKEYPLLPDDVDRVSRWIRKWKAKADEQATLSVLFLGQWTTSWLMNALEVEAWIRGVSIHVEEGEYDQVLQETFKPITADIVILLPWTKRLLANPNQEGLDDEVLYWHQVWTNLMQSTAHRTTPPKVIQVGYDLPSTGPHGFSLGGQTDGPLNLIQRINQTLRSTLPNSMYFADLNALSSEMGKRTFYDARQYHWTKQPLSRAGIQNLASLLWAGCRALTTGAKKVLVLDLDHTLWGGVVGEEGATGVAVGGGASGEAFSAFQRHCKALGQRGIVLAVASKNNVEDAQSPFKEHPEMVLKLDDFAAFQAHWESKAISLQRIAKTLNLGLDSFVFFDDHPVERAVVRDLLPEVEVVDVPTEPALYVEALEKGYWFETIHMTKEDLMRSQQYQQEQARKSFNRQFESLEDYLSTLEMTGLVSPLNQADLPRVLQLIGKTNQFNFTTQRHSQAYVESLQEDPRSLLFTLRVSDRFGDYGLVSVILGIPHPTRPQCLKVDTWLMSCRVIGRTVEDFFFSHLVQEAKKKGYTQIEALYRPTKKNQLISELLPRLGGQKDQDAPNHLEGFQEEDQVYLFNLQTLELPSHFVSLLTPDSE